MKAEDLAAYFSKKIAKPIAFDLLFDQRGSLSRHYYAIEPTAVRDNVLHAMVTFKHALFGEVSPCKDTSKPTRYCGEAVIPMESGDTVEAVLDMAIIDTVFSLEARGQMGTIHGDERRLLRLAEKLDERQERAFEEETPQPGPGR
jgi:hypothetical protein